MKSCSSCQYWYTPAERAPCGNCGNEYLNFVPADELKPVLDEPEMIAIPPVIVVKPQSALATQEGGEHYKKHKIQPIEFIHANNVPFMEANVVKYIIRHKDKNGAADIKKAIHYCKLLLELDYGEKP